MSSNNPNRAAHNAANEAAIRNITRTVVSQQRLTSSNINPTTAHRELPTVLEARHHPVRTLAPPLEDVPTSTSIGTLNIAQSSLFTRRVRRVAAIPEGLSSFSSIGALDISQSALHKRRRHETPDDIPMRLGLPALAPEDIPVRTHAATHHNDGTVPDVSGFINPALLQVHGGQTMHGPSENMNANTNAQVNAPNENFVPNDFDMMFAELESDDQFLDPGQPAQNAFPLGHASGPGQAGHIHASPGPRTKQPEVDQGSQQQQVVPMASSSINRMQSKIQKPGRPTQTRNRNVGQSQVHQGTKQPAHTRPGRQSQNPFEEVTTQQVYASPNVSSSNSRIPDEVQNRGRPTQNWTQNAAQYQDSRSPRQPKHTRPGLQSRNPFEEVSTQQVHGSPNPSSSKSTIQNEVRNPVRDTQNQNQNTAQAHVQAQSQNSHAVRQPMHTNRGVQSRNPFKEVTTQQVHGAPDASGSNTVQNRAQDPVRSTRNMNAGQSQTQPQPRSQGQAQSQDNFGLTQPMDARPGRNSQYPFEGVATQQGPSMASSSNNSPQNDIRNPRRATQNQNQNQNEAKPQAQAQSQSQAQSQAESQSHQGPRQSMRGVAGQSNPFELVATRQRASMASNHTTQNEVQHSRRPTQKQSRNQNAGPSPAQAQPQVNHGPRESMRGVAG
ncbi:hypothetical protein BDW74DRAFT_183539 [Aspergillus multicolor]|uniref:uncharacterized protein n=1 Tax=Aspergillus multicolor TaxID=41759 RepID=UPI003CCE3B21